MGSETRNAEIRKDSVNNKWIIFSPARAKRPSDFKSKAPVDSHSNKQCPFCIGNEHQCAPEIFRVSNDENDNSNWCLRVIENLHPALNRDLNPDSSGFGGNVLAGFGFHDVVIESPVHSVELSDLSPRGIGEVVLAYKKRIEQLLIHGSIKYIQVFKNHGASAGASMSHSHSQIMGLPVIPPLVSSRLDSMKEFFQQTGKCSICDIQRKDLLIDESTHFISLAPFAASFPFEMWIIPKGHFSHFHEIDSEKAKDLGGVLKLMLRKMHLQLTNPPFNFMIHTAPLRAAAAELSYCHWYIQIVPQLTTLAGFEIGTGCYINPVFPEDAAKILRELDTEGRLEVANRLKRGGGGRIILISTSLVGGLKPGYAAYAASKAAVDTLAKITAKELKGSGITVNCVAPGPIATGMFFEGKTEEQIKVIEICPLTKDVAPIVSFLASDSGEWVNDQVIRANGGYV